MCLLNLKLSATSVLKHIKLLITLTILFSITLLEREFGKAITNFEVWDVVLYVCFKIPFIWLQVVITVVCVWLKSWCWFLWCYLCRINRRNEQGITARNTKIWEGFATKPQNYVMQVVKDETSKKCLPVFHTKYPCVTLIFARGCILWTTGISLPIVAR